MFAYCNNNPANSSDPTGMCPMCMADEDSDQVKTNTNDECSGGGSGGGAGGTWSMFMQTMQSAANGLNMACGAREGIQKHHFLSNKNLKYKHQFQDVTNEYKLNLNDDWNVAIIENHSGRHTDAYHEFMLEMIHYIDDVAQKSQALFLEGFQLLADFVLQNNWILYG